MDGRRSCYGRTAEQLPIVPDLMENLKRSLAQIQHKPAKENKSAKQVENPLEEAQARQLAGFNGSTGAASLE